MCLDNGTIRLQNEREKRNVFENVKENSCWRPQKWTVGKY